MREWQPPTMEQAGKADSIDDNGRLPGVVRPLHYEILLQTDLESASYLGYVKIEVEVLQKSNSVKLNSVDLEIQDARLQFLDGSSDYAEIASQPHEETITLTFETFLEEGTKFWLCLHFKGILEGKLSGFYRGSYKCSNSTKEKYYAITQMQACDARRALPCFDEPALKARFSVVLIAEKGLTCLSNMDVKCVQDLPIHKDGIVQQAYCFNTTPLMSTYLLAFAIGEFNYIEVNDFHVPIRVYTTPDRDVREGQYAAELTAQALAFYEEKFGAKYPLPKLDLLGVATKQGAMENWGLIMFQDRLLLENKDSTSALTKELIANVSLHEEAHLWFGDLVTMEWWEGLWLNESFADWVSLYAVDTFNPTWQTWNSFVANDMQEALISDSLRSSHPIEVHVKSPGQINQVFDNISYQKGASVLRMLAIYLGVDIFVDGVRRYIQAHAFGNTKTNDLWEKLSEASGVDVASMMRPWTRRIGYPIVTVTEDECNNAVYLAQGRYLRTGDVQSDDDTVIWPIFLGLKTEQGTARTKVLHGRRGYLHLSNLDFFKINSDHTGVYRTLYTPARLTKLALAAQKGILSVADRVGLLADAASLSTSGHQSSALAFNFVKALLGDDSFFVWKQIVQWFTSLQQAWLFESVEIKNAITAATLKFTSRKAHELGWNFNDSDASDPKKVITDQFKALMFTTAAFSGDADILSTAHKMFTAFMSGNRTAINVNLRATVFALAIRHGSHHEYAQVLHEYHKAETSEARAAALSALGHATCPDLISENITLLFDKTIPFLDLGALMTAMSSHRAGVEALFDIMLHRWDELRARSPAALGGLRALIMRMTAGFATEGQARALEGVFEGRDREGLDRQLAVQVEEIEVKVGWVRRSAGEVEGWLREEGYLGRG